MQENHRNHQVAQAFRFRPPLAWQAEPKPLPGKILQDIEETLVRCPTNGCGFVAVLREDLIEGEQVLMRQACTCGWLPTLGEVVEAIVDVARVETLKQLVSPNFQMAGKGVMPN